MAAIIRGSGSLFPNNEILDYQLDPSEKEKMNIESAEFKGAIPISEKTIVDLTRLGMLEVNRVVIYDGGKPGSTEDVFDGIAQAVGSASLAHKAVDLFQQNLGGEVLKKVTIAKGLSQEIEGEFISTHAVNAKRKYSALNAHGPGFEVVHEQLIEVRLIDDPDQVSYFKIKTLVQGKTAALEARDARGMKISVAYTKEYKTMEEVLEATYWGTLAGGIYNVKSHIGPIA